MKTRFILALLVLLIGASVWYFKFYKTISDTSLNGLVPQSSVGVIITDNPEKALSELSEYPWWQALQNIPFLKNGKDQLLSVQQLIDSQKLQSKLNQLEHAISLHITGNDQIETLHFIRSDGFEWSEGGISQIINMLWPENESSIEKRTYEGLTVSELTIGEESYAFSIFTEYLVYSSNPILLEDVIRTVVGQSAPLIGADGIQLKRNKSLNLILNTGKLRDLERVFFTDVESATDQLPKGLLQLDMNLSKDLLMFNGIVNPKGDENSNAFTTQEIKLSESNYLPSGLSMVETAALEFKASAQGLGAFDMERFLELHEGSVTQVAMDAGGQGNATALIATITDPSATLTLLDQLAIDLANTGNDTLYTENFMDASITFLNKDGISKDFYGDQVPVFDQNYYTIYNNVLIIGESVDIVKLILSEYDDENTWGKIVERRQFLDDLIQEAVYTKLINFQFSVDALKENLKPKWKAFFDEQQDLLNLIDLMSVQLTNSGNGYYSSAQISLNPLSKKITTTVTRPDQPIEELGLVANAFADATIVTRPFVVRNHNNGSQEIMFQDENNALYLVNKDGTVIWKKAIGQRVNGRISQIDFYNNRRLQYLFATDSAMYLIDRNGDFVEDFPKPLNTELRLLSTAVIDYDNSKRYRYAGYDRRGNTYLFGKNAESLDGWNPRAGGVGLLEVPRHIRVRGRDCFVIVRQDGTIELTNRRGEFYEGFPYKVGKRLSGEVRIRKGPDFNRTLITVMSVDGQQISLNLNGGVQSRSQIFKPAVSSSFELVNDKLGTNHVVVRKDRDRTVFFDSQGKELFTSDLVLDEDDQVAFYNFRNESEIYLINKNGQLHVLNKSGNEKLGQPVSTDYEVGLVYYQSRGEYELFINFDNQFALYKFSK